MIVLDLKYVISDMVGTWQHSRLYRGDKFHGRDSNMMAMECLHAIHL